MDYYDILRGRLQRQVEFVCGICSVRGSNEPTVSQLFDPFRLLKFKDKPVPEKQSIDVSFSSGVERFMPSRRMSTPEYSSGMGFHVRIEHTARSWGVDLDSLISGHISSIRRVSYSKVRAFAHRHDDEIQVGFALAFFAASALGILYRVNKNGERQAADFAAKLSHLNGEERLRAALDIAVNQISSGSIQKSVLLIIIFLLLSGFASLMIVVFLENALIIHVEGALLLTTEAEERFKAISENKLSYWNELAITVVVGTCTGVIANYIFGWLTGS